MADFFPTRLDCDDPRSGNDPAGTAGADARTVRRQLPSRARAARDGGGYACRAVCARSWRNWPPSVTCQQIVVALGVARRRTTTAKRSARSACWATAPACSGPTAPRVQGLYQQLNDAGLTVTTPGKGRSVWTAFGYLLADPRLEVFALHDCDIVNYDREMLARLCLPLVHPSMDFEFCKAYYARVTDRMHGRVVRLLVSPLLRALISLLGYDRFLVYLDSFRYPLSGEFAVTVQPGQVEPHSQRLGLGGGDVGRGVPQHVDETRLPSGSVPRVRAQASVAVAGRSQQGPDEDGRRHSDQHFPHVGQHGHGAAAGALHHAAVGLLAFRPGRHPPLSCRRPDERPAF